LILMGEFLMQIKSNIFLRESILFTLFYASFSMFPHTFSFTLRLCGTM